MEDPKKLKIESPYDPEIPLLGKNKKQNPKTKKQTKKNTNSKRYMYPNIHSNIIVILILMMINKIPINISAGIFVKFY